MADGGAKPQNLAGRAPVSARIAFLFVALAATAVITPIFFLGNPSGHDIQFHLSSWMDVSRQWREGILFPRWSEWANWGFGEPRFIFYPPVSWLLGAALGSALSWEAAPGAMIWISLVIAGMAMWKFTREWLPGWAAVVAAMLFAADPYHLVMLYYRSDFAELLGAALLPLLFWAVARLARGETRCVPALAAAFAAIWLCNAPAGVMATYSLVLALAIASLAARSVRPLLLGGAAMVLGFTLDAFYILPAAYEQRWVQIKGALTESLLPIHNFLFAHDNELGFVQFNTRTSRVAMCMMAATLIAGVIILVRRRQSNKLPVANVVWWTLIGAAVSSVFLMTRASLFLWNWLPKLQFVQFPWRWMDVLAVPLACFVAGAAASFRKKWASALVVLVAAGGLAALARVIVQDAWWDDQDAKYVMRGIEAGHGFNGTDEYAPYGASHWDLPGEPATDDKEGPPPPETPRVEEMSDATGDVVPARELRVNYETWNAERRKFLVSTAAPTQLVLRSLNYPAWDVRVDGAKIQPGYVEMTGQMTFPVDPGQHEVDIRFIRTWDRTLGGWISVTALFVFIGAARNRRSAAPGEP